MTTPLVKDPADFTNFRMDFSDLLEPAETIATVDDVDIPADLTEDVAKRIVGTYYIDFWLSGGVAFTEYDIQALITTNALREYSRTMKITVEEL